MAGTKPITDRPNPQPSPPRDQPFSLAGFQTTDWYTEVKKGNVGGHSILHSSGRNANVPTTFAVVSSLGNLNWQLQTATTMRIKAGGSAVDDAAGLGAQEVTLVGLDETLEIATEAIVTAGVLASTATTTTFLRTFYAQVTQCGTYAGSNDGVITIENGTGGTDLLMIEIDEGRSQFGGLTIPAGDTGFLAGVDVTVDANKPADVRMFTLRNVDDITPPVEAKVMRYYWDGIVGNQPFKPRAPGGPYRQKTDIWFEARGDGPGAEVSVDFELLVIEGQITDITDPAVQQLGDFGLLFN